MEQDVTTALQSVSETLTTMQNVGLAIVMAFIVIIALIVVVVVLVAFMRRSTSADAQLNKSISTNERWATSLDKLNTTMDLQHLAQSKQVVVLDNINASLASLKSQTETGQIALSGQFNTLGGTLNKKLDELTVQGAEILTLLSAHPGMHAEIRSKLEQLLESARRDKRSTSEMKLLTPIIAVQPAEPLPFVSAAAPETNPT